MNSNLGEILESHSYPQSRGKLPFLELVFALFYHVLIITFSLAILMTLLIFVAITLVNYTVNIRLLMFYSAATGVAVILAYLAAFIMATKRKLTKLALHNLGFSTRGNSYKTTLFDKGFNYTKFITDPSYLSYIFRDINCDITSEYKYISSISIYIGSLIMTISASAIDIQSNNQLLFMYVLSEANRRDQKLYISSPNLAQKVMTQLEEKYWSEIKSKILTGKEVSFGKFHLNKDYIWLGEKKVKYRTFLMSEIKEFAIERYGDSDSYSWVFSVVPMSEYESTWFGVSRYGLLPHIQDKTREDLINISNFHLLIKCLAMLKKKINLDILNNIPPNEIVQLIEQYANGHLD